MYVWMGASHVETALSHLVNQRSVSPSTHRQALSLLPQPPEISGGLAVLAIKKLGLGACKLPIGNVVMLKLTPIVMLELTQMVPMVDPDGALTPMVRIFLF